LGVALLSILAKQGRSQLVKQSFQLPTVAQSLPQLRRQFCGNVHATTASLFREGKDESAMFIAGSARRTVGTDTGLVNFGQGTFAEWPQALEFDEELSLKSRMRR
jgi:hypothetical protein